MCEKKIWVLLAEDNKLVRKLKAMQLHKAGFQMLVAEDGAKALDILEFCTPDCILLDILMPKMHGHAFLTALRKKNVHLPVIIMSEIQRDDKFVMTMENLGIQGWVTKRTSDKEIAELIRKAVLPADP
jgi:two-component system, OmpR family, response regulator VicR